MDWWMGVDVKKDRRKYDSCSNLYWVRPLGQKKFEEEETDLTSYTIKNQPRCFLSPTKCSTPISDTRQTRISRTVGSSTTSRSVS